MIARLALLLALLASPAWAQTAPVAPAPPSEVARAAARELGERLGFTNQAQDIIASVRNQVAVIIARGTGKPPEEVARAVDEVIMPDFTRMAPELVGMIVDAWAVAFSPDELRELQRFYSTPVGAKLTRNARVFNQQMAVNTHNWAQHVLQASIQAHDAELRARGLKN
ncbi:MAG TPA: DUF2059 domain-containing protein [Acetobacteraceae bacterium]|jgi:hypothetical protein